MNRLRVAAIVEGHGEVQSVPILLHRLWYELLDGEFIEVLSPPIRRNRNRFVSNKDDEIAKAVGFAAAKLSDASCPGDPSLILILVDADEDPPCKLGPDLLALAKKCRPDQETACVIANVEYETWFVAAAGSLRAYLDLTSDEVLPEAPESNRLGKSWIERRFQGAKYSETIDQPRLTARMDLRMCRRRSPSFDKLCREFELRRHR